MRIENIEKEIIKKETDNELFSLRMRFSQLYKKFYKTSLFKKSGFIFLERKDFLGKYKLLIDEIKRRRLKVGKSNELDKMIFSKEMVGVDIKSLPDIPVRSDYISITGSFLKSPKSIGSFSIYIRDTADKRLVEVEERVKQVLEEELSRSPAVVKHEEPEDDYLPVYELVLRPKEDLKIIKAVELKKHNKEPEEDLEKSFPIEKPEETDKTIRIPVNDCEVTATITISAEEGIKALYCGKAKKIRTYIFDKAHGWTMAKAKKWIKEHKEKADKEENEHSARLQDPKKYDDWRRTKGGKIYFKIAIPASISIVWGHPKGKPPAMWIPQALRFPKDKYTVAQAKKFLADNEIKYISFEEAKKEEKQAEKSESGESYFKFEKVDKKQQIVGGIIYEPNVEDTQGDFMESDEIEKMAYKYMLGDKKMKINHKGKAYNFPIIESYIPDEDTKKGGQTIKKGAWWLMIKVEDKKIWADIESGKLGGFSMGGVAAKE